MLREAYGLVAPASVRVRIEPAWRAICREEADRRQARDNRRRDRWGRGLSADPHYLGLLAECAVADYLGLSVNFQYGHDAGFDLKCRGIKIDVKGSRNFPLIRELRAKKCHRFVFATVNDEYATLLGWIPYERVVRCDMVPSVAHHLNYRICPWDLEPMEALKRAPAALNLLRYPGGKARLWKGCLDGFMPESGSLFAPHRYVEPMVGGGGVALRTLARTDFKRVLLADLDYSLIALWRQVRDNPRELAGLVEKWLPNVDDWYRSKEIDGNRRESQLVLAFNKLVLHYASHAGIGYMAGGPQGGRDQANAQYPIGCRWNPDRILASIRKAHKLIQGAEIVWCSFRDIELRSGDFVYGDPPYIGAGAGLYRHPFHSDDHRVFASWIRRADDWVVTYDKHPMVYELYRGCTICEFRNATGNNKRPGSSDQSRTELVIRPGG